MKERRRQKGCPMAKNSRRQPRGPMQIRARKCSRCIIHRGDWLASAYTRYYACSRDNDTMFAVIGGCVPICSYNYSHICLGCNAGQLERNTIVYVQICRGDRPRFFRGLFQRGTRAFTLLLLYFFVFSAKKLLRILRSKIRGVFMHVSMTFTIFDCRKKKNNWRNSAPLDIIALKEVRCTIYVIPAVPVIQNG